MNERTCIDIFTGLACFSIAARVNGVRTVAMCECKPDCRNFLAANWPDADIYPDAKTFNATQYRGVWLVCGGPPCQPASLAGKRRGAADDRWLWPQAVRIVGEAKPAWFLFENPPGINGVGLDGVLSDLEGEGYEIGTLNIPACAVDSPQRRERLWIVGHAMRTGQPAGRREASIPSAVASWGPVASSESVPWRSGLRDSEPAGLGWGESSDEVGGGLWSDHVWIECGDGKRRRAKPGVCGLVNGPSVGLLESLGNAIVWPVAARIIAAMIQSEG